jgi:hypothetical protein
MAAFVSASCSQNRLAEICLLRFDPFAVCSGTCGKIFAQPNRKPPSIPPGLGGGLLCKASSRPADGNREFERDRWAGLRFLTMSMFLEHDVCNVRNDSIAMLLKRPRMRQARAESAGAVHGLRRLRSRLSLMSAARIPIGTSPNLAASGTTTKLRCRIGRPDVLDT